MMNPLGLKALLFDLDGTLIDTYKLLADSHMYATKKVLGRDIPEEVLMSTVGMPLETQMADHCGGDPDTVIELCRVYREYNERRHDELIEAFPHVSQVLQAFADAGLRMGIVTSKRTDVAMKGLDAYDLAPLMECVIGGHDCATHKPHPGPVLAGCEALGLAPAECAYIGDSPYDLQAGRGAGCLTIAANWGMFAPELLAEEQPDFTAGDMLELQRIVLGG